jgi:multiple sugar transport system permease protein
MKRMFSSITDGRGFDLVLVGVPFAFLLALSGLPLLYNILMSFQEVDMFSLGSVIRPFVGFKNYVDLFTQPETMSILRNTIVFVVGSITGQFLVGFALALFFWINFPGASWLRGLFLVSWVMPGLVVGAIWNWILSGDFGVLNFLLQQTGLMNGNIFWRSDPNFSLWAVILANIWLGTSFNMILLATGLAAIPADLYEAAEMDGANAWQRFWTITLPMMRSTIGAIIALGLIFTLQQFDLFAAITDGGPNNSSNVAQYWAWDLSFRQYDFGKGATISVIMTVFVMFAASRLCPLHSSRGARMSDNARNRLLLALSIVMAAVYLFPLYWMYVTALKSGSEMFATPPSFWPWSAQWSTFAYVWESRNMGRYLWNSTVIAFGAVALIAILGTGCAYVLARYRNIWVDVGLFLILMFQVLPASLMITPIFVGFSQLGLLEYPRLAVVLAITAKSMPFFVVLVRATFMAVPMELEEAALVDGNSRIGAFFNIVLPLARNGILVSAILIFMQAFGEFVYSKSMIQDIQLQPASVGLNSFMGPNTSEWNNIMAYATMYVTPILAIFVLLQRRIVSGLTSGALK